MLNLSNESFAPESPTRSGDRPFVRAFRRNLLVGDVLPVERLVREAGVFNPAEVRMARELVEEALGGGTDYHFLFADGVSALDGYTCYGPIPGTAHRFELYWIATRKTARRCGLARALLQETEASVRQMGGTHLFAETSTRRDYAPAHALYATLGYARYCTVPDYHADGDGLAIFGKRFRDR